MEESNKIPTPRRWYVSGPMAVFGNDQEYLTQLFTDVAHQIRHWGMESITPLEDGLSWDAPYVDHLLADLRNLNECQGVYLLPGWEFSRGCRIEVEWARRFGIPIYFNREVSKHNRCSVEDSLQALLDEHIPHNVIRWKYVGV